MNNAIQKAGTALANRFGRTGLILQKYSPEILLGAGIVGAVAATVLACKATLKADEIVQCAKEDLAKIEIVHQDETAKYTEQDYLKDKAIVFAKAGVSFGKLYGPALGLGAASIVAILSSHGIMTRRQVGLVAAYNIVAESFSKYRQRVVDELGLDADKRFRFGVKEEEIEVEEQVGEGENKKLVKKKVKVAKETVFGSDYARMFDTYNVNYQKDPLHNMYFLTIKQTYFNDMLRARGHVFLNEVYEELGFPKTKAGQVVGWIKREKGDPRGDGNIDFDLFNTYNSNTRRDFINGFEPSILLDFNVDGPILDLLPMPKI